MTSSRNDSLHSSLLSGTLSIHVADVDIRRRGDSLMSSIETDYILQIRSPPSSESYCCSKRYADFRSLTASLRGHAQAAAGQHSKDRGSFGGLARGLSRWSNSAPKPAEDGPDEGVRASASLDHRAPGFVKQLLLGVEDFCDAIHSERKQYVAKMKYDQVKKMSQRRRAAIDKSVSGLLAAVSAAQLASRDPSATPAIWEIVAAIERFLLTDFVIEKPVSSPTISPTIPATSPEATSDAAPDSSPGDSSPDVSPATILPTIPATTAATMPEEEVNSASNISAADPAAIAKIKESFVSPLSVRHRESKELRTELERSIASSNVELEISELLEPIESPTPLGRELLEDPQLPSAALLLPVDPTEFGTFFALGVSLLWMLRDKTVTLQQDSLLVIILSCGLLGYHLASWPIATRSFFQPPMPKPAAEPHVEPPVEPIVKPPAKPAPEERAEPPPRPRLGKMRPTLLRSDNHLDRKSLIRLTLSHQPLDAPAPTSPSKRAAPTLPRFPSGAAIGSHNNCWSLPTCADFQVRGANYLQDKKKVPSGEFLFPCRGLDLFLTDNAPSDIGRNESLLGGKLRDVPTFVINYRLPWGVLITYHEIPTRFLPFLHQSYENPSGTPPSMDDMSPGERAVCRFLLADQAGKDATLKIVPVVVEGPWMVKRVVGGKPAIVGTKLPLSYVYRPRESDKAEYLEVDLDIVSSAAARNILAVVRSYTQTLTIDLGFVVQGNQEDELPEQMMVGTRLHGLDPLRAELLPEMGDLIDNSLGEGDEEDDSD